MTVLPFPKPPGFDPMKIDAEEIKRQMQNPHFMTIMFAVASCTRTDAENLKALDSEPGMAADLVIRFRETAEFLGGLIYLTRVADERLRTLAKRLGQEVPHD